MEEKYEEFDSDYLKEKTSCGESRLLFKTQKAAEEHIERNDLIIWLINISSFRAKKYSLEQLRKVKEILGQ